MKLINAILSCIQIPRSFLHVILFSISSKKDVIMRDIERWIDELSPSKRNNGSHRKMLVWLLWKSRAFRNLFYYRIASEERILSRVISEFAKIFFKPIDTLFLYTPVIGPGLFIQHGFSTAIGAKSIGKNCWINQQVTIGFTNDTDRSTIGDNVRITAGAIVIGDVKIGDNSVVGANAVVVKDVPPNCVVVGVPARIIRRDGRRVDEKL